MDDDATRDGSLFPPFEGIDQCRQAKVPMKRSVMVAMQKIRIMMLKATFINRSIRRFLA